MRFRFDALVLLGLASCAAITVYDANQEGQRGLNNESSFCSDLNANPRFNKCNGIISSKQMAHLEKHGYVVIDNILTQTELSAAIKDVESLHEDISRTGLHYLLHKKQSENSDRDSSNSSNSDSNSNSNMLKEEPEPEAQYRTDSFQFLSSVNRSAVRANRITIPIPGTSEISVSSPPPHPDQQYHSGEGEGLLYAQNLLLGVGAQLQLMSFGGFNNTSNNTSSSTNNSTSTVDANTNTNTNIMKLFQKKLCVPDEIQLSHYFKSTQSYYKPHRDGIGGGPNGYGQSKRSAKAGSGSVSGQGSSYHLYEHGLLNYLRLATFRRRYLTAILYLNNTNTNTDADAGADADADTDTDTAIKHSSRKWIDSDGGVLRLYRSAEGDDPDGSTCNSNDVLDIKPVGGRLVLFDSKEMLHAVLPTERDRVAITAWYTME